MNQNLEKTKLNNIIEILKQALNFYSNQSNYNEGTESLIFKDNGFQAKFALEKAKEMSDQDTDNLINYVRSQIKDEDISLNKINEIKNIINQYKK